MWFRQVTPSLLFVIFLSDNAIIFSVQPRKKSRANVALQSHNPISLFSLHPSSRQAVADLQNVTRTLMVKY